MKKVSTSDRSSLPDNITTQQMTNNNTHRRLSMAWRLCKANRYVIISVLLTLIMVGQSLFGKWGVDFWEHSAVVRELATHLFDPQHPLFMVDQPHAFFSPYLVLVGFFARLFSIDAFTAFTLAGVFNLLLLLVGLRLFVHYFFAKGQGVISFYALIFILFLWPEDAWNWSGFFYFKILGEVLPYPATFALAVTFLIFALYYRALQSLRKSSLLAAGLLTTVVLLTHPTTAAATITGIVAISLHFYEQRGNRAIAAGLLLLLGAGFLAFLWPYYSFLALLRANDAEFHSSSYVLYQRVTLIWPTLLLLPFAAATMVSRVRQNKFDALVLMLGGSVLIFVGGFISEQYGFGRIISFIAIILQIAAAAWMAQVETNKQAGKLRFVPAATLLFVAIMAWNPTNASVLERSIEGGQGLRHSYADYAAMGQIVDQYDVVLADLESSWRMPTFGGKVIASMHPAHWVDDHQRRRQDLELFFADDVDPTEKMALLDKYRVNYILVDRSKVERWEAYFDFGEPVFESERYVLVAVDND